MASTTQYLFDSSSRSTSYAYRDKSRQRHQRRKSKDTQSSDDDADGSASLSYSTASSVNSWSVAGESHDSSFADIMRVLDLQDGRDLPSFLKHDAYANNKSRDGDDKSTCAESLAYSTDDNESQQFATHTTMRPIITADDHSTRPGDTFESAIIANDYEYADIPNDYHKANAIGGDRTKSGATSLVVPPAPPEKSINKHHENKRSERSEQSERQAGATTTSILRLRTVAATNTNTHTLDLGTNQVGSQNRGVTETQPGPPSTSKGSRSIATSTITCTKSRDESDPEDLFQTWMVCLSDAIKNFTSIGQK